MVRFVPPAPLDAATLGGAFSLHYCAELILSVSLRFSSIALPFNAVQFTSLLFRRFSGPCYSLPMLCYASHCKAIPLLFGSAPHVSFAVPVSSLLRRSLPLQHITKLSFTIAMPGPSLRLRCVTRFPPSGICLSRCFATDQCRRSAHSPASRAQRRYGRRTGRPP